ncbi:MAG: 2,3-bisphosphoglycerate-independent phosphoglycerate mutase [Actinomycetes bacterium]|jgi:2,3-bisphosphoglycerate-independent phosphoglycerate mutase|nr:2,3-bisphosphoglycerate-independent phosphoglycerate mutase [Actinomycetes bacterium]
MKYAVVILDGAAGNPCEQLGGLTTLAAAQTPLLDLLAGQGTVGVARTVPDGIEPSSSVACTSILGYDPIANYVGRGAIEAAAQGITLAPDQVAMRINTLTLTDGIMTSYAGGHIADADSRAIVARLAQHLNDDTFTFYPGHAYRHILVVTGHPEILQLEYTPPHDISDRAIDGNLPRGDGAGLLLQLMERAHAVLADDPTNAQLAARGDLRITDIWPFWPGAAPGNLQPFSQLRGGVRPAMTSGVDLLHGLANLFGFRWLELDGVTDGLDNDFAGQCQGALDVLDDDSADLVVIHVEAPDEMGHAGDIEKKCAAIELIDSQIITRLFSYGKQHAEQGFRLLAMPDHYTPIETKTHQGIPVPFLLWGTGIDANGAVAYNEAAAAATGLALDPAGYTVMDLLLA